MTLATKNIHQLSRDEVKSNFDIRDDIEEHKLDCDEICKIMQVSLSKSIRNPFGGKIPVVRSPFEFASYLKNCNVGKHFTIQELVIPNYTKIAKSLGYDFFIPPVEVWPIAAGLLFIADFLRGLGGEPIEIYNYWRPYHYNLKVAKSSKDSDHPSACALDLEFASEAKRAQAVDALRMAHELCPELEMSIGVARERLHVGILSPRGSRKWEYASYNGVEFDW